MAKAKIPKISYKQVAEYTLKPAQKKRIAELLGTCFSEYPIDKIFIKQAPHFRLLACAGRKIIGQIAVDFRHIKNGEQTAAVFCLSDVCVDPVFQSQKIASQMLQLLEKEAAKSGLDFLLLTAADSALYYRQGYRVKNNIFKWLIILDAKSLGLKQRRLEKTVMVKRISKQSWSKNVIDLAGPIF